MAKEVTATATAEQLEVLARKTAGVFWAMNLDEIVPWSEVPEHERKAWRAAVRVAREEVSS